jgi:protein-S-isoprenylcysteine O-methyltransferase Ste14
MVAFHFLLPVMVVVLPPWCYVGALPILLGVALNIWADRLLKRHQTTVKPHLEPTSLVTSGPFGLSRNPIYVGMIAIAAGVAVLLGTLAPMVVAAGLAAVLALKFVPMEEDSMAKAFGAAWQEYRQRVRRWL